MNKPDEPNSRFGIASQVSFKQLHDGIVIAEIDKALADATISHDGEYVFTWWPKHQSSTVLVGNKADQVYPSVSHTRGSADLLALAW